MRVHEGWGEKKNIKTRSEKIDEIEREGARDGHFTCCFTCHRLTWCHLRHL